MTQLYTHSSGEVRIESLSSPSLSGSGRPATFFPIASRVIGKVMRSSSISGGQHYPSPRCARNTVDPLPMLGVALVIVVGVGHGKVFCKRESIPVDIRVCILVVQKTHT